MVSLAIAFISILVLRQLLHFQNQHRDRQQNRTMDPESCEVTETEGFLRIDKDETDWANPAFRYHL
jgi:hypothetical protein